MKQKQLILIGVLCFLRLYSVAQYLPKSIAPYRIDICLDKTSNLIFPEAIKSVDRGLTRRCEVENEKSVQGDSSDKMMYLLQKEILTFEEACLYLGRSASFMYKLTSGRLIPYYVPSGKLIYFKRKELDEWALHNKRLSIGEIREEGQVVYKRK